MNILVIANKIPMPDRASGEFRFYHILKSLASAHKITFYPFSRSAQEKKYGTEEVKRYQLKLEELNISVSKKKLPSILKSEPFDIVFFEFYFSATPYIEDVRYGQPQAHVIIDSVDIHFNRLQSKAALTGSRNDLQLALEMKGIELAIYSKADLIITVTPDDENILLSENPILKTCIIPNLHPTIEKSIATRKKSNNLLFVGAFDHEPNVNAMLYFYADILPLIIKEYPDIKLTIIGNNPPDEIKNLANSNIDVLGYVPDIAPYLSSCYISIAPLQFGGGMKGKIGEAMSYGLPVVTTEVGIEGFGLTPEVNVLIGNTPEGFSCQISKLLCNPDFHNRISENGKLFITDNYSFQAIDKKIRSTIDGLDHLDIKKMPFLLRIKKAIKFFFTDHILWRLKKST